MQLLISSPWWALPLCLIAGALYAFILYRPKWNLMWYKVLAVIRFITISVLSFFLLSPVLVRKTGIVQKPIIIMAMDNSQSIVANKDSSFYKNIFLKEWLNTKAELGKNYDVQYLTLGSNINSSDSIFFNEKRSNIGQLFDYINNTYAKQNVGAIVLASDGIYNKGNNPLYKQLDNHANLYTIGLGDSTIKKDIILKELNVNSIAYLGNDFPLDINITAHECLDNTSILTVTIDGKIIASQPIAIGQKSYFKNIILKALADQPGTKHIIATVSTIEGEISKINNRKDAFIEIIDGREKILLTYQGPHPDISALKSAINANRNYEIVTVPANEIKLTEISKYSVVILHQLPSKTNYAKDIIAACRQSNVPIWGVIGSQSAIDQISTLTPLAKIVNSQGRINESQAIVNINFNTFTIDDLTKQAIANFPPMMVPYGNYNASENAEILAYQKIGSVNTKLPIWALMNQDGEKTAILFGEGFWRWRITDFFENGNHLASNEIVNKTIQFLASKDDKRKFRVYPTKNIYEEDEAIKFIAELYNNSYELVNQVDVKIELTDRDDKVYKYTFSPYNKSFQLEIGSMPAGIYKFKASTATIPEIITGQLLVTPLQAELINTRADFGLLRQLAKNHNGTFNDVKDFNKTIATIKQNTSITSTSFIEKKIDELINIKWLFFLILFLLAFEWLVRKYEGGY